MVKDWEKYKEKILKETTDIFGPNYSEELDRLFRSSGKFGLPKYQSLDKKRALIIDRFQKGIYQYGSYPIKNCSDVEENELGKVYKELQDSNSPHYDNDFVLIIEGIRDRNKLTQVLSTYEKISTWFDRNIEKLNDFLDTKPMFEARTKLAYRNKIKAGLKKAREQGKILGRPRVFVGDAEILRLVQEGLSSRGIAERLSISKSTAAEMIKRLKAS